MGLLQRSLMARLLTYFLLLIILPLATIGYLSYNSGRQSIVNNVESHLESVSTLKEQELQNWVENLEHTMVWVAASPQVSNDAAILANHAPGDPQYLAAHESLVAELKRTTAMGHISSVSLLDNPSGKIIASSDTTWEGKFREAELYFIQGKNDTYISEIFHSLTLGQPTMAISAPVKDSNGQLVGVLAAHANLEQLSELMLERSGLGETGETFLVNKSNLLITNTVFAPDGAFKKWIFGEGAEWALEGKNGVGLFVDYRGEPVIGAYRWIEDRELALIAKQDQSEAFAPVTNLRNTIATVAGLILVLAAGLGFLLARQITNPLSKLAEYARRVGMGDYTAEVEITGRNEVASVASDVRAMVGQILATQQQLLLTEDAVRSSPSGIAISDLNSNLTYVNPTFLEMWGYDKPEEVLGRSVTSFWQEPDDAQRIIETLVTRTGTEVAELVAKRKDGTDFIAEVRTSLVVNAEGQLVALTSSFNDITERTQIEERLLESERLATLGQFSGNISHELRNPLGVIDSSAYYLKTKLKDADEKVHEHLDRIKASVTSSTTIIENLLNLTRMEEPKLTKLDLAAVTADAITTSKIPAKVNIIQNFPEEEVPVNADQEQLRMTFKNIIKNAHEAMGGKGTLTVTVSRIADDQAEVSFTDTGTGIAVEDLEKVFQPLFSRKAKGIGFGLSIAKMVIDKHGGAIEAKSEPGKGATIVIQLPLYIDKEV